VRFGILTAVTMKSTVFCDITPGNQLKVNRRFEGIYRPFLQGRRISRARNQTDYEALYPRSQYFSYPPLWEPQILYIFSILARTVGIPWARGSLAGWGTMLQVGRSRVQFPTRSLDFLISHDLCEISWFFRPLAPTLEQFLDHFTDGRTPWTGRKASA
jgi:hypothetical protein